jgi:hypothetical protein
MVREEYPITTNIIQYYHRLLRDPKYSQQVKVHRKHAITIHREIVQTLSLQALLV